MKPIIGFEVLLWSFQIIWFTSWRLNKCCSLVSPPIN